MVDTGAASDLAILCPPPEAVVFSFRLLPPSLCALGKVKIASSTGVRRDEEEAIHTKERVTAATTRGNIASNPPPPPPPPTHFHLLLPCCSLLLIHLLLGVS